MSKKTVFTVFKWVVSISLILWLYSRVDWSEFALLVQEARPFYLLLALILIVFNTLICSFKWKLFLRNDSLERPLGELFVSYWIGHFISLFLPSNIGGDAYRIYHLGNKTQQGVRSFTSVFADRFTGFLALVLIGLAGSLIGYALIRNLWVIAILVVFLGAFVAVMLLVVDPRLVQWGLTLFRLDRVGPVRKAFQSFSETFRKYGKDRLLVTKVMGISVVFHLCYITAVFLYSRFLGLEYPFYVFILFVPMIALFEALPVSVYGVGIRDSAYVYFFALVGMPQEQALAIAFVHLIVNVLVASFGGVLLLLRRDKSALHAASSKEGLQGTVDEG